ncbi:MAG: TolC family protein, partial [Campylobacterales bacterium]|nr:TolC family protein [Campylobacterales bacterium]
MKKTVSIVASLVLMQVSLSAFSLNEAVNEVVNTNPEVIEKVKDYNSVRGEVEQSYSGYYPTLDIEAEVGYERIKNSSTNYETKGYDIDSARVVLRENIFDGFGTQNLVDKSKSKLKSAKFDYLYTVNQKAYETIEAYLNILKSSAMSSLALENIKVHEDVLMDIKEKIDMNVGKVSEYDRVAGRLAMANSKYIIVQNDLKESIYFFHKLLGRFIRAEDLSMLIFNDELLPLTLEEAINKQFESNPQLKVANSDVDIKKYDYEISKKEFYPKIDLEVSKSISHDLSGIEGREDDFKAVVKMRYNILNGGYDYYENQKMISRLHAENEIQRRVKRTLLNDLQLSWVGYQVID